MQIKISYGAFVLNRRVVLPAPSTRRLLDGVAMPVTPVERIRRNEDAIDAVVCVLVAQSLQPTTSRVSVPAVTIGFVTVCG